MTRAIRKAMTSAMIRKRNESGFTLIELMMVVAILGGLAATAIPAFMRYVRRAHTVEALMNLKRLSDSALVYYEAEHADVHGNILARQFPVGLSGWMPTPMPSQICQFPGHKGPARWANDVFESLAEFHTLNFTMDDDIYFGYQIQSTDQLQVATGDTSTVGKPGYTAQVDAWGDQNCNGTWSHFWRTLTVDQNGAIRGGSAILDFQPLE